MDAVELFDWVKIIEHCLAELFHFYFNLILTLDLCYCPIISLRRADDIFEMEEK